MGLRTPPPLHILNGHRLFGTLFALGQTAKLSPKALEDICDPPSPAPPLPTLSKAGQKSPMTIGPFHLKLEREARQVA
jgi:hypothetical protein